MKYALASHPVYIITNDYPDTQKLFEGTTSHVAYNGETMLVYATNITPDTICPDMINWNWREAPLTLEYFQHPRVASPEEVIRALRGPQGHTGARGDQGPPCNCKHN